MAAPSARIRAWRSAFGGLRRESDEAAAVLELLAQAPALARTAYEIPPQEVEGDVLALLNVASKVVNDAVVLNKLAVLAVDLISSSQLEFKKESVLLVFTFLRGVVEKGEENNHKNESHQIFEPLNALAHFAHTHGQHLSSEEANTLLVSLLPLMTFPRSLLKSRKGGRFDPCVYTCIANIFTRAGSSITKGNWQKVVQAFRKVLDQVGLELLEETAASRYYATVLRTLQIVLSDAKAPLDDNVGGFVAILRMFISYGLSGNRSRAFSETNISSPTTTQGVPREDSKCKSSSLYRPPHLRSRIQDSGEASGSFLEETEKRTLFSDSEQSDNDSSLETDHCKSSKARTNAILCIQALARADPKSLHAHWSLLLPTHNVLNPRLYQPTLITTLIFDPFSKTRLAAASTISALLEGPVRAFMQVAEYRDSGRAGSFTTLSTSLGQIIVQLYTGLLHSLSNESQSGVLVAVLKALSLLVSSSPFDRLPTGILNDVINTVHKRIRDCTAPSDQTQTQMVAGIGCLHAVLAASSGCPQVLSSILEHNEASNTSIYASLIYLARQSPLAAVRIEALQALKAAIHSHSSLASLCWKEVSNLIQEVLQNENASYNFEVPFLSGNVKMADEKSVYHSVKLLDESLRAISGFKGADDMFDFPTASPCPSRVPQPTSLLPLTGRVVPSVLDTPDPAHSHWLEALNKFLPLVLYHGAPMVRAAALTSFAGLTPAVYSNLSEKHQEYILSTVLNAAVKDDTPSVRSAACRALGVLVGCSEIVERNPRISSVIATVQATIVDAALSVRITSCWALANVCDAFCKSFENGFPVVARDSKTLTTIAEVSLRAAKDGDKVRANAVRALGNLAKFADFSDDATSESPPCLWLGRMVQSLVSCITTGNVKVQWNVCHALGNLFLNKSIRLSKMPWASSVFSILLLLLRDSGNFKIRIHAASALAVPSCRDEFGESYGDVLHGLVHALESLTSGGTAPSSFKYMPTLSEQLDTTCLQVLSFATPEDHNSLKDFFHKRAAFLRGWLQSVLEKRVSSLENPGNFGESKLRQEAIAARRALENLFGDKSLQDRFESVLLED